MFIFAWAFEVDACSRFWRWNLIKICVRTCNMNSTLGSVVPLAMFRFHLCATRVHHSTDGNYSWSRKPDQINRRASPSMGFVKIFVICWNWIISGMPLPNTCASHHSWKLFSEGQTRPNQRKGKPDPPCTLRFPSRWKFCRLLPPCRGAGDNWRLCGVQL